MNRQWWEAGSGKLLIYDEPATRGYPPDSLLIPTQFTVKSYRDDFLNDIRKSP